MSGSLLCDVTHGGAAPARAGGRSRGSHRALRGTRGRAGSPAEGLPGICAPLNFYLGEESAFGAKLESLGGVFFFVGRLQQAGKTPGVV